MPEYGEKERGLPILAILSMIKFNTMKLCDTGDTRAPMRTEMNSVFPILRKFLTLLKSSHH